MSDYLLFLKDHDNQPTECRWCAVVVGNISQGRGEVLDAFFRASQEECVSAFNDWIANRALN